LDVCDATAQERELARHIQTYGSLDVAVLNAGIAEQGPLFSSESATTWQRTLDVDLTAVIAGCRWEHCQRD
jgi:NADP-dependent 3-hydroxy acid dehydrogenase YdfG